METLTEKIQEAMQDAHDRAFVAAGKYQDGRLEDEMHEIIRNMNGKIVAAHEEERRRTAEKQEKKDCGKISFSYGGR